MTSIHSSRRDDVQQKMQVRTRTMDLPSRVAGRVGLRRGKNPLTVLFQFYTRNMITCQKPVYHDEQHA